MTYLGQVYRSSL